MEISGRFQALSTLSLGKTPDIHFRLFRQKNNLLALPVLPSLWTGHSTDNAISGYSENNNNFFKSKAHCTL